ncbi:MAG TPA: hypothetical protein PLU46_00450 [Thiotrichales bacterium]|nr:hypothetical protein [Thiotrichales bacterium]
MIDKRVGTRRIITLTKGLDNPAATSGNDTFIGAIDNVANSELNTLSSQDIINGGAGIDTLKIAHGGTAATTTLGNLSNVEIVEVDSSSTGGVTVNSVATTGVTNLNVVKAAGAVSATAGDTTDVSVAMKSAGNTVGVVGGKNVTVKLSDVAATADVVTIGAGTAPKGDVVVEMTGKAYTTAAATTTLSAVTVNGGKTVSVTQKAAADTAAAAADLTNVGNKVVQGAIIVNANADTTTVTVKQDAAVAAVDASNKTGGSTETASVKFGALKALDTLTANGLTFTAAVDMTAAEVAAVFANLANGTLPVAGDTQGSGLAGKGTYTGVFATSGANGWTSAAANGDTVVFTAATANTNVATNLAFTLVGTGTAPVVTTTEGKAHDGGATGGKMGVDAGVVTVAASTALKTVTVDSYAAGSAITGAAAALDTVNLSNGAAITIADTADTLALNLEKVTGAVTITAAPLTLNVKSVGNNTSGLVAAAATAVNVSGTGLLNATGANLAAAKTIKVTETAGLNLTGATLTALESVDTTGTTGTTTVSILGTQTTYTGGAGVDTVTVSNAGTAATKAIDLGAGNDKLTLVGATVLAPTAEFKGGDGIDTLSIDVASADALDAAAAFATKVTGFERLELTGANGAQTIDTAALGNYNDVTVTAGNGAAATLTLNNLSTGATIRLNDAVDATNATDAIVANIKDADKSTSDVLNVVITANAAANTTADGHGTITAAEVETVNISVTDGLIQTPTNAAPDTQNLTLQATKATKIVVTGDTALNLTNVGNVKVAEIDGSAMTAGLTVQAAGGVASTIKGGSGNDVLTASGGAGGGTAQVSTLTFTDGAAPAAMAAGDSIAVTINGNTVTQAFTTNFASTLAALNTQINNLGAVNSAIAGNVITITAATVGVPFTVNTVFTPNDANITGAFQAVAATTLDRATMTIAETTAMDAGDSLSFTITDAAGVVSTITQEFDTDLATTIDGIEAKITAAGYTVVSEAGGVITIEGPEAKGNFTVSNATFTDNTTTPSVASAVTGTAADAAPDFLDTATLTLTETVTMGADDTITVTVTDAGGVQTSTAVTFNTDFDTTMGAVVTAIEALTGIDGTTTAYDAGTNVLTVGSTRGQITNLTVSVTDAAMNSVTSAFATTTANVTPIGDTLIGGAGNDTLNSGAALGFMTGGEGKDLFVVNAASTNVNAYTTITDFTADDLLQFAGAVSFKSAKVELGATAVFQDLANAAINALAANEVGWFQFNNGTSTDTYVVMDKSGTTAFVNGTDMIVKLTGAVDLTNASFNNDYDTIALV